VEILGEKLGLAAFSLFRKKKCGDFFVLTYFSETTVSPRLLNPGLNPSSVVCISAVKMYLDSARRLDKF
jgi:hypothetical protein